MEKLCPYTVNFFVSICGGKYFDTNRMIQRLNLCVMWLYEILVCNFSVSFYKCLL